MRMGYRMLAKTQNELKMDISSLCLDTLVAFTYALILFLSTCSADKTEFCDRETFKASCDKNQVIMMDISLYGRMRRGGCISVDDGIGCLADVTVEMDAKCSGRKTCSVSVPDDDLYRHQGNCPEEMIRYLQATYHCVEVSHPVDLCLEESVLTGRLGYVVNSHTDATCTWHIQAASGQRLNLTLYDFGVGLQQNLPQNEGTLCQKYGHVREESANKQIVVCSGRQRMRNIYLSEGNEVDVVTQGVATQQKMKAYFLIKYETVGCADPVLPVNSWMHRQGDSASIVCNATGQKHNLVCRGDSWVGEAPDCSLSGSATDAGPNLWNSMLREWKSPYGVIIIVGLGVALGIIIGALLLFIVLIYFRRREYRRAESRMTADEYDCVPPEILNTVPPSDHNLHSQLTDGTTHYSYRHPQDFPEIKVLTRQGTIRSQYEDVPHESREWSDGNAYSDQNPCLCDVPTHKIKGEVIKKKPGFVTGTHFYETPK